MQARELKLYLLEDTDRIYKLLEEFGFHAMWLNSEEIRCATPNGTNRTSVSIKLVEELYATSFDDELGYRGDLLGLLQEAGDTTFANVMRRAHSAFGLKYDGKVSKKIDLLKNVRRFKRGNSQPIEVKKYDRSILEQYIKKPHASMIEEAISPDVLDMYDIRYDVRRDRVIFPHFDWEDKDKVVGIQGRTTLSSELAKELNVPKYWNYITGYRKSNNLYSFSFNKENIEKNKMIILFEGEKSVLKQATIERGKGYAVALGGHEISEQQKNFILKNTSEDVEVVIAFDKDIMENQPNTGNYNIENDENELGELELACKMFSKFRKTSYVYDKYGILNEKDSPIDRGVKRWSYLLNNRIEVKP